MYARDLLLKSQSAYLSMFFNSPPRQVFEPQPEGQRSRVRNPFFRKIVFPTFPVSGVVHAKA